MTGSTILADPIFEPQRASGIQYGPRLIDSAPPASATSTSPDWIACVADTIACTPVPHRRFTVNAGVSCGIPAFIPTTRAMYMSAGSVWITLPKTTWSIWPGSMPARSMGATDSVVNPATGEEIAQVASSTQADVDRAVTAARAAFDAGWSTATPGERSLALLKLADAIEERADELAQLEAANAGKPINAFRDDEIPFMVDNLRFFAGAARNLEGKAAGEYVEGYTSYIRREPVGVIGQIAPWHYPLMMAVWKIGPER